METISVISKSLHRYDTYIADSEDCNPCKDTWQKIRDDREKELAMLMKDLKEHLQEGGPGA